MGVVVSRIEPGDGRELRAVRLAALLDSPWAFGSSHAREVDRPVDEWERRAVASSAGDATIQFLARNDERVVGVIGAYRPTGASGGTSDSVELVSMWVAPEARREGVARRLVTAVTDWAADTGAESVMLWVTATNEPARRLYAAMGFETTGETQPLPSDPDLTEERMRLSIGPPT